MDTNGGAGGHDHDDYLFGQGDEYMEDGGSWEVEEGVCVETVDEVDEDEVSDAEWEARAEGTDAADPCDEIDPWRDKCVAW